MALRPTWFVDETAFLHVGARLVSEIEHVTDGVYEDERILMWLVAVMPDGDGVGTGRMRVNPIGRADGVLVRQDEQQAGIVR